VTAQDKTRCVTAQDKTRCVTAQDKTQCVAAQDKTRNRSTSLARHFQNKFIDAVGEIPNELTHFSKTTKSFARAFLKARRSRATPLSLSAESETPLGEAQHSLPLKGGLCPPLLTNVDFKLPSERTSFPYFASLFSKEALMNSLNIG